jgi:hypothetical protein
MGRQAPAFRSALSRVLLSALAVTAFAALLSCSGEAPSILSLRWTLVLRDAAAYPPAECLSVFISVEDADGRDDLESIFIAEDGYQLVWKLDKEHWTAKEEGGGYWIGSNALSMADGSVIPRGTYRVILRDVAGDGDETAFTVKDPGKPPQISLKREGSSILASAPYPAMNFIVLDASGETLASVAAPRGRSDLSSVLASAPQGLAKGLVLMSVDESRNLAVQTAVIALP